MDKPVPKAKTIENNKRPHSYKLICELAFGAIPDDWQWAVKTEAYSKIEKQIDKWI